MTRQSGQNIIISFSTSLLKSGGQIGYFLTYLKLRRYVEPTYGSFTSNEQLAEFLKLSNPTVKKHVRYCLKRGWIRSMPGKVDQYRIVSMYDLGNKAGANHALTTWLYDDQLFSITYNNVANLKALFEEYENERYNRHKKYLKRQEDKEKRAKEAYRQPRRKRSNGSLKGEPVTYFASGLTASLTGVSRATAHRHRSRDKFYFGNKTALPVIYTNSKRKVLDLVTDVSDLVMEWNTNKELAIAYFADGDATSALGQEILYGRFLICKDGIYLRAAAQRSGRVEVRRLRIGRRLPIVVSCVE